MASLASSIGKRDRPKPNILPDNIKEWTLKDIVKEKGSREKYALIRELRAKGDPTFDENPPPLNPEETVEWHIDNGLWNEAAKYLEHLYILDAPDYKDSLVCLFQNGTTSEIAGSRKIHEKHMGTTAQQMVMAGVDPIVYSDDYAKMAPFLDFRKAIKEGSMTWGQIKKYYSWFTGVKMYREPDEEDEVDSEKKVLMSLVGNEDEHVLPVGFMLLFGGGLAKKILEGVMREHVIDSTTRVDLRNPLFGTLDDVAFEEAKNEDLQSVVEAANIDPIDDYNLLTWEIKLSNGRTKVMEKAYGKMNEDEIKQFLLQNGLVKRFLSSDNPKAKKMLQGIKEITDEIEKEGTDRPRLLQNVIKNRQGVNNSAINLLKCMYEEDESIEEFLLYQLKLNYYGYFLSEGKANRIKSDNLFLKMTIGGDDGMVKFEPSDSEIKAFLLGVDALLLPFRSDDVYREAKKLQKDFKEKFKDNEDRKNRVEKGDRKGGGREYVYCKKKLTTKTLPSGWESARHYDRKIAKENIMFILEKLSFYLNRHTENRIFFNIIMSQLNLKIEEEVESTVSTLPSGKGEGGSTHASMVSDAVGTLSPGRMTTSVYVPSPNPSQRYEDDSDQETDQLEKAKEEAKRLAEKQAKERDDFKKKYPEEYDVLAGNAFHESAKTTKEDRQAKKEKQEDEDKAKEYSKNCHKVFVKAYLEKNVDVFKKLQKVDDHLLIERFLELGISIGPTDNKSPPKKKKKGGDDSKGGKKKKSKGKKKRTKKKRRRKKKTRGKR
jgi:hypothetical protein